MVPYRLADCSVRLPHSLRLELHDALLERAKSSPGFVNVLLELIHHSVRSSDENPNVEMIAEARPSHSCFKSHSPTAFGQGSTAREATGHFQKSMILGYRYMSGPGGVDRRTVLELIPPGLLI